MNFTTVLCIWIDSQHSMKLVTASREDNIVGFLAGLQRLVRTFLRDIVHVRTCILLEEL